MKKKLVAYFSASGITAGVAKDLAEAAGADLYEIRPQVPYTLEDLDWKNEQSRSSIEMKDRTFRPALADKDANISEYDVIYVGFPIWWYSVPTIINTFLEAYDFSGKSIVLFATSGGGGFGNAMEGLNGSCPGAKIIEGHVMSVRQTKEDLKQWVESLDE